MKCTVEDVKPGAVLYKVLAFPHRGFSESSIEEITVTSKPFVALSTNSLFAHYYAPHYADENPSFSLCDAGIVPNDYNFHQTFTTRDSAKEYARRMDVLDLTPDEIARAIKMKSVLILSSMAINSAMGHVRNRYIVGF